MTSGRQPENAPAVARNQLWFVVPFLTLLALFAVSVSFNGTIELTPDHADTIAGPALLIGLAGGGTAAIVTVLLRPFRGMRLLGLAVLLALVFGLMTLVDAICLGENVAARADFAHGRIVRWQGTLPLDHADVSHGKGDHYAVRLAQYGTYLSVFQSDYQAAFGKAERVDAEGWCIRTTLERDGAALRMMQGSMTIMPHGSLVRCPTPAANGPGR